MSQRWQSFGKKHLGCSRTARAYPAWTFGPEESSHGVIDMNLGYFNFNVSALLQLGLYGLFNIFGILDSLWEGIPYIPWPAQPFKHTESHSFKHTATTFKYTNWYSYYLQGLAVWPALHIFKCCYRTSTQRVEKTTRRVYSGHMWMCEHGVYPEKLSKTAIVFEKMVMHHGIWVFSPRQTIPEVPAHTAWTLPCRLQLHQCQHPCQWRP